MTIGGPNLEDWGLPPCDPEKFEQALRKAHGRMMNGIEWMDKKIIEAVQGQVEAIEMSNKTGRCECGRSFAAISNTNGNHAKRRADEKAASEKQERETEAGRKAIELLRGVAVAQDLPAALIDAAIDIIVLHDGVG